MPDPRYPWLDIHMHRSSPGAVATLKSCKVVLPDGTRHELVIAGFNYAATANGPASVSIEMYDHRVQITEDED